MNRTVTIESKNHNPNTYGGYITEYDFCTDYPRKDKSQSWADRIARDLAFDKQCWKNLINRTKKEVILMADENITVSIEDFTYHF